MEAPGKSVAGAGFSPSGSATAAVATRLKPMDPRGWMVDCLTSAPPPPSPGSTAPYLHRARGPVESLTSTQAHASTPHLASVWRHDPGGSEVNTTVGHHGCLAVAGGLVAPLADNPGVPASPRRHTFDEPSSGVPAPASAWANSKGRSVDDTASAGAVTESASMGEASRDRDPFGRYRSLLAADVGVSLSAQNNSHSIPYVRRRLTLLQPAPDGGGGGSCLLYTSPSPRDS